MRFSDELQRTLKAGKLLTSSDASGDITRPLVYRLRSGWACQFRKLTDGRKAIVDIYLPGDVIGLDAALNTRPTENVAALTTITVDAMIAEDGLYGLMMHRHAALYVTWLLGQRQRRADRLLTAISSLDARGRLAVMFFDFYHRLRTQKLIMSAMYNLPLTQSQIGSYLGLTVVHVSRVLALLRSQQIVNFEKHCVNILDLAQLTRLAQHRVGLPSAVVAAAAPNKAAAVVSYSERGGLL
ncbi:MAG: Crp/Fnr family transcriptional regulator [Acidobacteria bacterium]|nr:Crp/Fnr family transcriptional regulator [Acidobacteriota bacterium]